MLIQHRQVALEVVAHDNFSANVKEAIAICAFRNQNRIAVDSETRFAWRKELQGRSEYMGRNGIFV
jgi:hypothetical protein